MQGTPLPIQWIVELFIFDGDGIRFGRYFRVAGYYTTIFLWFGFALWFIFSTISLFNIPAAGHGGLVLMLQGLVMILAFVFYNDRIYNLMPNRDLVVFPFADADTGVEAFLELSYGWITYVVIVTGALDIVAGLLIIYSKHGFHADTDEENDTGRFRRALQKQQDNGQPVSDAAGEYQNQTVSIAGIAGVLMSLCIELLTIYFCYALLSRCETWTSSEGFSCTFEPCEEYALYASSCTKVIPRHSFSLYSKGQR